jgi:hypothetical protein
MHSVVSNVPVDDETPVVTLGVSRSVGAQSFEGAHRGRVCVCVFIGVSLCACYERLYCTVQFLKNKKKKKNLQICTSRSMGLPAFSLYFVTLPSESY